MEFLSLLISIGSLVITGLAAKWLAEKKGYDGYFWTGFLLSVVGLVYVAGLPDVRQTKELEKALKEHEQRLHERTREMMAQEVQKAVQEALAKAAPAQPAPVQAVPEQAKDGAPEPAPDAGQAPDGGDKGRTVKPGRYWAEDILVPGRLRVRSTEGAHMTVYARGGRVRFDEDVAEAEAVVTIYGDDQILITGGSIRFYPAET